MADRTAELAGVDPNRIYNSDDLARLWSLSRDTRQQWYRTLRSLAGGSVRKNGAHFLLTGGTAFETFPVSGDESDEAAQ